METIDGDSAHRHRWRRIGAHALHAGHKPCGDNPHPEKRVAIRELRHVSVCMLSGCKEVRVPIRQESSYACTPEQAEALARRTKRIPGRTAVALVRREKAKQALALAKVTGADFVRCRACASDATDTCQPLNGPDDMMCPCGKMREPYDCQADEWMKA